LRPRIGPPPPCDPSNPSAVIAERDARATYLRDNQWIIEKATDILSNFDRDFAIAGIRVEVEATQTYLRQQAAAARAEERTLVFFMIASVFSAGFGIVVAPLIAESMSAAGLFLHSTVRRRLTANPRPVRPFSSYRNLMSTYLGRQGKETIAGEIVQEVGQDVANQILSASISDQPYSETEVVAINSVELLAYTMSAEIAHLSHQTVDVVREWNRMAQQGHWEELCGSLTTGDATVKANLKATQKWINSSSATGAMLDQYGANRRGMTSAEKAQKAQQIARHWALVIASLSHDPTTLSTIARGRFDMNLAGSLVPGATPGLLAGEVAGFGYALDGNMVSDALVITPVARALSRVLYESPEYAQSFARRAADRTIEIRYPLSGGLSDDERNTLLAEYRDQVAVKAMSRVMVEVRVAALIAPVVDYVRSVSTAIAGQGP
jgi:hypothetical protein